MKLTKKLITAIAAAGFIGALAVSPAFGEALPAAPQADVQVNPLSAPHILPPL